MKGFASRRLMANRPGGNKCANAMQQCAHPPQEEVPGRAAGGGPKPYLLAGAPLADCSFLHSERNFLRSLPCRPLASASFEHSSEAAVRGFSAFFSVAAGAAAGAVEVCAKAAPANRSEAASARPAARVEIVIMETPRENRERGPTSRRHDEQRMNKACRGRRRS